MRVVLIVCLASLLPQGQAAQLSPDEEGAARKIYLLKCGKCHEFYEPSDYGAGNWTRWMEKMKKKSRLNSKDYDLVLSYTQQLREAGKSQR